MRPLHFMTLTAVLFLSLGCKGRSIVGTWESTGALPAKITFNADQTFDLQPDGVPDKVGVTGNYSIRENRIKLSQINIQVPEGMALPIVVRQIQKDQELTLSWKTDDEIILDGQGMLRGGFKRVR